jgi:hypothetical protein
MSGPVEVVLSLIGLSDVSGQVKTPLSLLFLVATAAISVLLGALRNDHRVMWGQLPGVRMEDSTRPASRLPSVTIGTPAP